jgi:hypothetical protein
MQPCARSSNSSIDVGIAGSIRQIEGRNNA